MNFTTHWIIALTNQLVIMILNNKLFFGLPGNPISCAAGFRFFIYPLLRNSLGMLKEKNFRAQLVNKYSKSKNFTHFARCLINFDSKGSGKLQALQGQQSHSCLLYTSPSPRD